MMKNKKVIKEMLNFQDLTEEEKKSRGILGRLYGPCASIIAPTRNGRKYSDEVWEKVFNENEIVKEMFANGGIPMELDHPADREETCSEKIAAMLPEPPKKDNDGHLICYVDLIDTPCGRIAYQLAKYGFKLGISSRGTGDLYTDADGNESVDPDTYDFTTFDLVLLPAVKDARLTMTESYKPSNEAGFKKALVESLEVASDADKRVMEETLKDLNISLTEEVCVEDVPYEDPEEPITDLLIEETSEETPVIEETESTEEANEPSEETSTEAPVEEVSEEPSEEENIEPEVEAGEEAVVEAPKAETIGDLVKELTEYNDDLSVEFKPLVIEDKEYEIAGLEFDNSEEGKVVITIGYNSEKGDNIDSSEEKVEGEEPAEPATIADDETSTSEEVASEEAVDDGNEEVIESLKEMIRQKNLLEQTVSDLKAAKTVGDAEVEHLKEELNKYKTSFARVSELAADSKRFEKEVQSLTEQLSKKDSEIAELKQAHKVSLTESAKAKADEVKVLTEKLATKAQEVEDVKVQATENATALRKTINERTEIAKKYKAKYESVVRRYIESKASMLGVRPTEITSRLNEHYSLDDVDKVCEELLDINFNTLPFNTGRGAKVNIKESNERKVQASDPDNGYEIDDDLLILAGLK